MLSNPESISLTPSAISFIILPILSMDSFDVVDNFLISYATTENPFPDSPALAASIDAFNPNKFVCDDIPLIILIISSVSFVFIVG